MGSGSLTFAESTATALRTATQSLAQTTTTEERQSLYDEVWAEPVVVVAKCYGLSGVGIATLCPAFLAVRQRCGEASG